MQTNSGSTKLTSKLRRFTHCVRLVRIKVLDHSSQLANLHHFLAIVNTGTTQTRTTCGDWFNFMAVELLPPPLAYATPSSITVLSPCCVGAMGSSWLGVQPMLWPLGRSPLFKTTWPRSRRISWPISTAKTTTEVWHFQEGTTTQICVTAAVAVGKQTSLERRGRRARDRAGLQCVPRVRSILARNKSSTGTLY